LAGKHHEKWQQAAQEKEFLASIWPRNNTGSVYQVQPRPVSYWRQKSSTCTAVVPVSVLVRVWRVECLEFVKQRIDDVDEEYKVHLHIQ